MARKMVKGEAELRSWWTMIEYPNENKRSYFRDIRAFEKAVREGCAKVVEAAKKMKYAERTPLLNAALAALKEGKG
jgi:hypothetical protein